MAIKNEVKPEVDRGKGVADWIMGLVGGEKVLHCIQCGTCSGGCPLGYAMEFPPRKIVHSVKEEDFSQLLQSPSVWMCVSCYTCSALCPKKIELTDMLWPAVRDRAMQEGFQPPAELQKPLQNLNMYGNVFGESPRKRLNWADGVGNPKGWSNGCSDGENISKIS